MTNQNASTEPSVDLTSGNHLDQLLVRLRTAGVKLAGIAALDWAETMTRSGVMSSRAADLMAASALRLYADEVNNC